MLLVNLTFNKKFFLKIYSIFIHIGYFIIVYILPDIYSNMYIHFDKLSPEQSIRLITV